MKFSVSVLRKIAPADFIETLHVLGARPYKVSKLKMNLLRTLSNNGSLVEVVNVLTVT